VVGGDALPRLGGGKNRVSRIALAFAAPRNFCHGPIEAASAARGANASKALGDLAILSKRLETGKGLVAEAVMPPHQFCLIVRCGNTILVLLGEGRRQTVAEVIANGEPEGDEEVSVPSHSLVVFLNKLTDSNNMCLVSSAQRPIPGATPVRAWREATRPPPASQTRSRIEVTLK